MIDLTSKELPSIIEWEGGSAKVLTDFRVWLTFERYLSQGKVWLGIFADSVPDGADWLVAAIDFLKSPNKTPRDIGRRSNRRTLDYLDDGDYIVAAFQQAYGIDLTSCDMHWHRFHALLVGLPEDTLLSNIMGYRGWEQDKRKLEDRMAENRARWQLEEAEDDGMGGWGALLGSLGVNDG